MCSTHTATFPDNNGLSNNLHDNPVLPGFSTSPGWVLVTLVADVVFADVAGHTLPILLHSLGSAHKNGMVKSFTHTSIPIHPCTLLKNEKEKERAKRSTDQTWCLRLLVLFLSTVVLGDGQEARHLLLRTAPRRTPSRLGQQWQKTFADIFNKYYNIARKQSAF